MIHITNEPSRLLISFLYYLKQYYPTIVTSVKASRNLLFLTIFISSVETCKTRFPICLPRQILLAFSNLLNTISLNFSYNSSLRPFQTLVVHHFAYCCKFLPISTEFCLWLMQNSAILFEHTSGKSD